MKTLVIRKVGSRAKKALTFAGEGEWAVMDAETAVATARSRTTTHTLEIETDGRRLTAEMPGMYRAGPESAFTVADASSGEPVVEGTRIAEADTRFPLREKWAITFATGSELAWMYKTDPPELGFYDGAGDPVMVVGHHVALDPSPTGGTFRILLRMWGAAAKSTEEYAANFDEQAIAAFVQAWEVPVLALLGMWLERRWDVKGRASDTGFS